MNNKKTEYELDASSLGLTVIRTDDQGREHPIKQFEDHQEAENYISSLEGKAYKGFSKAEVSE